MSFEQNEDQNNSNLKGFSGLRFKNLHIVVSFTLHGFCKRNIVGFVEEVSQAAMGALTLAAAKAVGTCTSPQT